MRTKTEIRDIIAQRLEARIHKNSSFSDLASAIQGTSSSNKTMLVEAVIAGNQSKIYEILNAALKDSAKAASIVQADSLLTDDTLTLAEIDTIL